MKQRNLFWGGILVTLGILFILKNINLIEFNWFYIFKLWPILLIMFGVTLLPIKNAIKTILTVLLLAVTILLMLLNSNPNYRPFHVRWSHIEGDGWSNHYDQSRTLSDQHFYEPYNANIKAATLEIDAAIGELRIANKTVHLMDFTRDGNIGPYYYSTQIKDDHQKFKLSVKDKSYKTANVINDVFIKLNPEPIWNFVIDAGAAEVNLNLSEFKTKDIDIDGGASEVVIRLGEKYERTEVTIDSGVSSIEIYIPKDSGCEINTDTFLSSKDFDHFERIKRGLYQTENYESALNKIHINIDAAISSIEVIRY